MTIVTGLLLLPRWFVGQVGCQKLSSKHRNEITAIVDFIGAAK